MRLHYFLHIIFLLSYCLYGFIYGPVFIGRAFSNYHKPTKSRFERICIKGLPSNTIPFKYLDLEIQVEGLTIKKFFYAKERDYKLLEKYLINSSLIDCEDKIDTYNKFPINVSSSEKIAPQIVEYKYNNDNKLVVLCINGTYILGENYFLRQKIGSFIIGLILFPSSIFFFFAGIKSINKNIEEYKKTGKLPLLTDKTEGLQYIINLFKSRKDK